MKKHLTKEDRIRFFRKQLLSNLSHSTLEKMSKRQEPWLMNKTALRTEIIETWDEQTEIIILKEIQRMMAMARDGSNEI